MLFLQLLLVQVPPQPEPLPHPLPQEDIHTLVHSPAQVVGLPHPQPHVALLQATPHVRKQPPVQLLKHQPEQSEVGE